MILQTDLRCQESGWQQALASIIRDPDELLRLLELDRNAMPQALAAAADFPLKVPRGFAARMQKGNWHDPLLQQVLPSNRELEVVPGYSADPLDEVAHNPVPGLIHKYHGRVLLIVSGGCAIHCRYCFRRHFPYEDNNPGKRQWQQALDYIRSDSSIEEVIFSGGDPLSASDRHLAELARAVDAIPHVTTLRIHSRMPVVLPERICADFLDWLLPLRLRKVMVIHSNHANELSDDVAAALAQLRSADVTLLNQTVLLKGINDNADTLTALSRQLHAAGVLPYYLHLLDRVAGAAHFDIDSSTAVRLIKALRGRLPGYLVPKLVKEEPGATSKTPV